jgi:hypothetical protein
VLGAFAEYEPRRWDGKAGSVEVDGSGPGDTNHEMNTGDRVADLFAYFSEGGLLGQLVGLDSAGEDGPAALQPNVGFGPAEIEEEVAVIVDEDDADAGEPNDGEGVGQEPEEEHPPLEDYGFVFAEGV